MNGEVCCILGVCCPPAQQELALSRWMAKRWQLADDVATTYAHDLLAVVDLGPKGKVQPLLKAGADVAKHAHES